MHTKPVANQILLEQLRWRYATKKFNPARRIPDADWATLEEALVLTPSSYGLQPWKFIVITDPETKQRLLPHSWNQPQVVDCSHHVVFAIKTDFSLDQVDAFMERVAQIRGMSKEQLAGYRGFIVKDIIEGPRSSQVNSWATCQAYIALGNFMTCAALLGIDTCPMEGMVPEKYDEILGLKPKGLATAVACAAGYRAADDKYAQLPKVRFNPDEIIEHLP